MVKIAVIGGRETVLGFKALGLDVFPVEDGAEAKPLLRRLAQDTVNTYAIIYVEENLAEELDSEIEKYKDKARPAIILIPGKDGPLGLGQNALRAAVERAVGSDIL
jgi:V/A-type H+-transporting ATPase subunit F